MDMTTLYLFIGCLVFFIMGIAGAVYHYRRVKTWDKRPSSSEYMECLLIGWCSWMLIALAGTFTVFTFVILVFT
jgi:hypothetical protein